MSLIDKNNNKVKNGPPGERQLFEDILYITHKSSILQNLFRKWTELKPEEKTILNYVAQFILPLEDFLIYIPLMRALYYWNMVQDTQGACGYNSNPLNYKLHVFEEQQIYHIILTIKTLISQIVLKTKLNDEYLEFEAIINLRPTNGWNGQGDASP